MMRTGFRSRGFTTHYRSACATRDQAIGLLDHCGSQKQTLVTGDEIIAHLTNADIQQMLGSGNLESVASEIALDYEKSRYQIIIPTLRIRRA